MLICTSLAVALTIANATAKDANLGSRIASLATLQGKCARASPVGEGEEVVSLDAKKNVMVVVRKVLVWDGTKYRPYFTVTAVRYAAV